ncbi:hypothetical protein G7Y89_g8898 [Cudoniella acicularis]|uniref:3-oxo-5-alpha-steroid 4-dehydrogenase C-terminal domain-containing protein n=1 Tax=Cudoniella acicularis TaxID=354080 RepID=A0A8H4W2F7_9HELO|nr:hypothetical protein G7Y89_g8898 [Cudoniella acicularis]
MEVTEGDSKDIVSKDLSDNSPPSSLDKELPAKQEALVGTTSEELPELCLALFIAQMETSIVSTSIISVTNDLGGFVESSWVFTAYLLTYSVLTIQLPQRFQTVNGQTPMAAGIRLLAFGLVAQAGSVISAVIIGKTKIPPIYHILFGSVLQVVGTIGLSRASLTSEIEASQYAWQVVAGLGVGFCNVSLVLLVKSAAQKIDQAAMTQFRVLGGILSLAIVISVMNRKIRSDLLQVLPQNIVYELLQTTSIIHTLSEETQDVIGAIFGKGYNLQMRIMIGFAAAQLPASALMWTKEPMMWAAILLQVAVNMAILPLKLAVGYLALGQQNLLLTNSGITITLSRMAPPLKFNIEARGKTIQSLPSQIFVTSSDTTSFLYEQLATKSGYSVRRLRITKDQDGKFLLENSSRVSIEQAELVNESQLFVKDLGPQVSWRTAYIIEYLGPLFIQPLIYFLRLRQARQPSFTQSLILLLVEMHFLKREYESICVHRFSLATMPVRSLFKNSLHYWVLLSIVAFFIYSPSTLETGSLHLFSVYTGLSLWVIGELGSLKTHLILRNLRPSAANKRGIPHGFGFDWVTSPNYTFEALAWVGVLIISRNWAMAVFIIASVFQMNLWAKKKEARYRREFKDTYKHKRFTATLQNLNMI